MIQTIVGAISIIFWIISTIVGDCCEMNPYCSWFLLDVILLVHLVATLDICLRETSYMSSDPSAWDVSLVYVLCPFLSTVI